MSQLSEETMKHLRSALTECLKTPDATSEELGTLMRKVAAEAHERDIKPEQLIVIVKDLWNSLAESFRQGSDQQERSRQRLVTLCIQAYYAA